jgi:putative endonuclease
VSRVERGGIARKLGRRAEFWAALYLTLKRYRIIARGYRTPVGEIDLIARRGHIVVFVEVKARPDLIGASDALRAEQRRRIIRAGEWFLQRRSDLATLDRRYDVVLITPWRLPVHLTNAW